MPHLRLAAAQLNTVVGDLSGNVERVLAALAAAEAAGADLCVVPELAIPGYPPEDLLLKPGSWPTTWPRSRRWRRPPGSARSWSASSAPPRAGPAWPTPPRCAPAGGWSGVYRKRFLPNYGVFDEQRWFVPSDEPPPLFGVAGAWVGVSICEDVWFDDGPVAHAGRAGADVVVNLNASPYNRGRRAERLAMLSGRVAEAGCAIAYVNQVGGQDELVFDGDSLIVDGRRHAGRIGRPVRRGPGGGRPAGRIRTAPRRDRAPAADRRDRAPPGRPAPAGAGAAAPGPERPRRGLRGARPGHPRLPGQERLLRGGDRPVGRDRLVAGGDGRRDALGPGAGARHLHALALLERRLARRRRGAGRAAGHRPQGGAHRGGPRRLRLHAGAGARARALRADRREPAVAPAGRAADGGVQRQGMDRAHHGQQERDGDRLLHALRRLGGRIRGDQGRAQDAGLRPVPLPQHPGRCSRACRARSPTACWTSRPRPSCARTSATTSRSRPTRSSTRCSRATSRATAPRPSWWRRASTPRWSTRWCAWSTAPSTSAARCRPGCGSPPRPSARTGACRSPTATAPRPWRSPGGG